MWHGIEGHDDVVERFRQALARGRLAHTFLFVGPEGVGKRTFAKKLAQALLCQKSPPSEGGARGGDVLDPCEKCPACLQVAAGSHPDLIQIARPEEKSSLPVELFIGSREKRGQEGLCHELALKPFMGGRRIAIIDDADDLAIEGANALLKTLEEPPPQSVLILIGTSEQRQLPTIRSRCQVVYFRPLPEDVLARLIQQQEIAATAEEARRLARFAGGSLTAARELADPALWEFRSSFLADLATIGKASVALSAKVTAFVGEAGKEAPRRRARARQVLAFAEDFFRQLLRTTSGLALEGDDVLRKAVERASAAGPGAEAAAAGAERCLDALEHIDRNASVDTALCCWADDLGRIAATGQPLPPIA
ncbi:MAG: DNA polymerase III subunit [Planctomycetia bacterium]|nr:DNA polymerase III subunit [Planctomycetia bacterium]